MHVCALWLCVLGPPHLPPAATCGHDAARDARRARVVAVVDANTVSVQVGADAPFEVDLLGVRVPATPAERAGVVRALAAMVLHEDVRLVADAEVDAARGATYLAREPDGLRINLELIRQGLCKVDTHPAFSDLSLFERYQQRARLRAVGVWGAAPPAPGPTVQPAGAGGSEHAAGDSGPAADADGTVYITKSGAKYHRATCRYARTGRPVPLAECPARLAPCRVCKPPPR